MDGLDLVYLLKDSAFNEELRYSVRSVERFFPHNRIWFIGGRPIGFRPDKQLIIRQREATKYDRTRNLLKVITETADISEEFVLFNDDFFVLKPIKKLPHYSCRTLLSLAKSIEKKRQFRPSPYTLLLRETSAALESRLKSARPIYNFELHVPFIVSKVTLRKLLTEFPDLRCTRSLYGNLFCTDRTELSEDVKIIDCQSSFGPEWAFCSTNDESFSRGAIGKQLKTLFPEKCRLEK